MSLRTAISRDWAVIVLAVAVGAVVSAWAFLPTRNHAVTLAPGAGWTETAWTYPIDPWWPSKAFTCDKATCGSALTLLVRAKIGFCNCKTGVADDEELERISDFTLVSARHTPLTAGRAIAVAGLKGRSRPYALTLKGPKGDTATALVIGYNHRCDAMVATALVGEGDPAAVEATVLAFLASPPLMRWTERTLGL